MLYLVITALCHTFAVDCHKLILVNQMNDKIFIFLEIIESLAHKPNSVNLGTMYLRPYFNKSDTLQKGLIFFYVLTSHLSQYRYCIDIDCICDLQ